MPGMTPGSDTDPDATATAGSPTPEPGTSGLVADDLARLSGRDLPADRGPRYEVGASIGRGGMGEVFVARDLDIGRAVAVKRMRNPHPSAEAVARFLREARVQGWLEHPAIVPVHDLGIDAAGRPFFTMKRLTGTTLLATLTRGPLEPAARRRLLRAFAEVCLAVEFAHTRGVIHRDLKPSNIVLGDFGEVYVLDWGVARIVGVDDVPTDGPDPATPDRMTQPGAVLGTPGYMAPEQRRGEPDVGPAADVYALGCILFEILAGQPLAARPAERPRPIDARPSAHGIDVAPELEAACVAATAEDPAARPSARALSEQLQQYLDGDRDAAQRRALAQAHVAAAAQALGDDASAIDADRRAAAMRSAGRALALDPTSVEAAQIVSRLVLEPPATAPPEVARRLADRDRETITRQGFLAARSLGTSAIVVALLMWLFVRSWPLALAVFAVFSASAAHAYRTSLQARAFRAADIAYVLASNVVILLLLSRLFGAYLIVPAIATAAMSGLAVLPPLLGAYNRVFLVFATGLVIPVVLEATGVWARTTTFAASGVVIAPLGTEVPAGAELLVLAAVLALLYAGARYVRDLAIANRAAQARLELQAWHLRQLIPPAT